MKLAAATWLAATVAHADKMTDAEELFRRGKALMAEKKEPEACGLFEESQKLDPRTGTLLNLAICHEAIGKIASAWGEFRAVEQQSRVANREDRVKLAHDRAEALEPRLPRLKIVVPPEAKVPGLALKVDGEAKGEPLWNGIAVDPGTRTVEVSAPGKKAAILRAKVDDEGIVVAVTLPKLEEAPPPPAGDAFAANRSRRTTGLLVGGLGAAGLVAGGVFGVLAITTDGTARDACPAPCVDGSAAAQAADDRTDRALVFANVANVVLPLAAIATAIGAYLFVSAGPTSPPPGRPVGLLRPTRRGGMVEVRW